MQPRSLTAAIATREGKLQAACLFSPLVTRSLASGKSLQKALWQLHELDLEEASEGQQAHTISTQQHCRLSPCQLVQRTARNSPQAAVTALVFRADTAREDAEKQARGITKNAEF